MKCFSLAIYFHDPINFTVIRLCGDPACGIECFGDTALVLRLGFVGFAVVAAYFVTCKPRINFNNLPAEELIVLSFVKESVDIDFVNWFVL